MKPRKPYPESRTPEQEKARARAAKVVKDIRRSNSDMPADVPLLSHKARKEREKEAARYK